MNNQKMVELLDIREWEWSDFKLVHDTIAPMLGEECAWKMLHALWQVRAGEVIPAEEQASPTLNVAQLLSCVPGMELPVPVEKLGWDISRMGLSVRSYNCLCRAGINTVGDVYNLPSFRALYDIKNLGLKSREEVIYAMREMGFADWVDRMCYKKGRIKSDG